MRSYWHTLYWQVRVMVYGGKCLHCVGVCIIAVLFEYLFAFFFVSLNIKKEKKNIILWNGK